MTPNNSDYLNAINAVQNPGNPNAIPTGYTLLYSSTSDGNYASSGLDGTAYVNQTTGQIIIAYSGPNTVGALLGLPGSVLENAAAAVDKRIGSNDSQVASDLVVQTNSFTAAVQNAAETAGYTFTNGNVFVTGWSEGGLLAQLTARENGFAGTSYGAPPIPGTDSNSAPDNSGFINYYYSKEPVGRRSNLHRSQVRGRPRTGTPACHRILRA